MDADEVFTQLSAAIRRLTETNAQTQKMSAVLAEQLELLLKIIVARGDIAPGHMRVLDKLKERAQLATVKVELSDVPDKYIVEGRDVDCASRMPICHGRCCSFNITMSRQDFVEGQLAWNIDQPYKLAKDADGYCVYQVHDTGGCGNYQHRPATCRTYSCAEDPRIWIDFDKRIPAPMPEALLTIRRTKPL